MDGPVRPGEAAEGSSRAPVARARRRAAESGGARARGGPGYGPQPTGPRSDRRARERADRSVAARDQRGRLHPRVTKRVVSGKYVLAERDGAQVLLEDHYVYVDGSRIEAVTRDAPAPGQEVIRYEHGFVMPGFVNLHAHCIRGGLFRGIPDDLEMEPYVPKLVYNILLPLTALAAKELSAEELRAVTALGMCDLVRGGTTTLLDMWHHGQEVFFDVAREVGLRTVGAPFIMSASNSRLGA